MQVLIQDPNSNCYMFIGTRIVVLGRWNIYRGLLTLQVLIQDHSLNILICPGLVLGRKFVHDHDLESTHSVFLSTSLFSSSSFLSFSPHQDPKTKIPLTKKNVFLNLFKNIVPNYQIYISVLQMEHTVPK